jgi:hypothetical protein
VREGVEVAVFEADGVDVLEYVGVCVREGLGLEDGVGVREYVGVDVLDGLAEGDGVGVLVYVGVNVCVRVCVIVHVNVGVAVLVFVTVTVLVLVGVGVAGCGITCIASTFAFSTLATNTISITPLLAFILLNTLSIAMFPPPAAAYMSKLLNTSLPFILTLNTLAPALV